MATIRSVRKQCRICGEDCSGKARVKDQYGHYYCRDCARAHMTPGSPPLDSPHHHTQSIDHRDLHADVINAIRAEHAQDPDDDSTQDLPPTARVDVPADAPADPESLLADDDDIIPLAPVDDVEDTQLNTCPVCFHRYTPEAGFCANCGYDEQRGIQSSRFIETSRAPRQGHANQPLYACPQCNHDMAHATSLVCPQCGHHMPTRDKTLRDQAASLPRESARTRTHWRAIAAIAIVAAAVAMLGLWLLNP